MSEHSYLGHPNTLPPPLDNFAPPDTAKGKALNARVSPDFFIQVRSVVAWGDTFAPKDFPLVLGNMEAWVSAFDLSTQPWNTGADGYWKNAGFGGAGGPTPDVFTFPAFGSSSGSIAEHVLAAMSQMQTSPDYAFAPIFSKCQVGITPSLGVSYSGYMIIALDIDAGGTAIQGCTYTMPPTSAPFILNLPVPSLGFTPGGSLQGVQYWLGIIGTSGLIPYGPSNFYGVEREMDLDSFASNFVSLQPCLLAAWRPSSGPLTLGPGWNSGQACLVPSGPPF